MNTPSRLLLSGDTGPVAPLRVPLASRLQRNHESSRKTACIQQSVETRQRCLHRVFSAGQKLYVAAILLYDITYHISPRDAWYAGPCRVVPRCLVACKSQKLPNSPSDAHRSQRHAMRSEGAGRCGTTLSFLSSVHTPCSQGTVKCRNIARSVGRRCTTVTAGCLCLAPPRYVVRMRDAFLSV